MCGSTDRVLLLNFSCCMHFFMSSLSMPKKTRTHTFIEYNVPTLSMQIQIIDAKAKSHGKGGSKRAKERALRPPGGARIR